MTLRDNLAEHVRAAFPGIWITTVEQEDALQEIGSLCRDEAWHLVTWDVDRGLSPGDDTATDPLVPVRLAAGSARPVTVTLIVLSNYHRYLSSPDVAQAVKNQLARGKTSGVVLVILSPILSIPPELETLFAVLSHPRPGRGELAVIAMGVATDEERPAGSDHERLLDAAVGLTRVQAENAFSLSLVRHGRLTPEAVWELKTQALKSSGLLSLHGGGEDFSSLGGLAALKAFTKRAILGSERANCKVRARGVLLLSPPRLRQERVL